MYLKSSSNLLLPGGLSTPEATPVFPLLFAPSLVKRDVVEPNIPLVARLATPFRNFAASAPGAAERTPRPPLKAPNCKPPELPPRVGGGVKDPDVRPRGLGDAVTVPTTCK